MKPKRKITPWVFTPEVLDDLIALYGVLSRAEVAARLSKKYGRKFTEYSIGVAANKRGITRSTAQPYVTVAQAADELGVSMPTLLHYCQRNGLKLIGRGVHVRYLADETWTHVQEAFKAPPVPTVGTGEAARRLHYTVAAIQQSIKRGKVTAYRFGGRWRVPLAWVEQQERAQRGARFIGEGRKNA